MVFWPIEKHWESAVVYTAKGIIQSSPAEGIILSSIMHHMRCGLSSKFLTTFYY